MRTDTATLIDHKARGGHLDPDTIDELVAGYVDGRVTDPQMAAFAMAVRWHGLDTGELAALCGAMSASGDSFRWNIDAPVVDKHSTGGVGDKVSIVLAPLLAAAGCAVPMLSGRGLGHTGGTLDKLEAIPGYRSALDADELARILADVGTFIAGAGASIAPADAKLYALRDHTGTVASPHLIAASIMSKKLAGGADTLVIDVRWGRGAFCRTLDDATLLAELMGGLAAAADVAYDAALSAHHSPLGRAIGNACEIREALDVLDGAGPTDTRTHTLALAERICGLAGVDADLGALLDDGSARDRFDAMVAAHSGNLAGLARPRHRVEVAAPRDGHATLDALVLGRAAWHTGAGRDVPRAAVDPAAGIVLHVDDGDTVTAGDILCTVEGSDDARVNDVAAHLGDQLVADAPDTTTDAQTTWWSAT
jgi:thymidine phosphorylase